MSDTLAGYDEVRSVARSLDNRFSPLRAVQLAAKFGECHEDVTRKHGVRGAFARVEAHSDSHAATRADMVPLSELVAALRADEAS